MSMEEKRRRCLLAVLARSQKKAMEEKQNSIKELTNLKKTLIFSNTASYFNTQRANMPSCWDKMAIPLLFPLRHYDPYFKKRKLVKARLCLRNKSTKKCLLNKSQAKIGCFRKENKHEKLCLLYFKRFYQLAYVDLCGNSRFFKKKSYEKTVDMQIIKDELMALDCNLRRI